LAVVNVADRADVNVRLVALKLTLCHLNASCERKRLTRRTGLVPPFKAFGPIAQAINAHGPKRVLSEGVHQRNSCKCA
ncbi:hypothetical protein DXM22_00005, partial [Agrobacterium vitis]